MISFRCFTRLRIRLDCKVVLSANGQFKSEIIGWFSVGWFRSESVGWFKSESVVWFRSVSVGWFKSESVGWFSSESVGWFGSESTV